MSDIITTIIGDNSDNNSKWDNRYEQKQVLKRIGLGKVLSASSKYNSFQIGKKNIKYEDPASLINKKLIEHSASSELTDSKNMFNTHLSKITDGSFASFSIGYSEDIEILKLYYNSGISIGTKDLPLNPPFQFHPFDDVRYVIDGLPGDGFKQSAVNKTGRVYAENIRSNFQVIDIQLGQDVYHFDMLGFLSDKDAVSNADYLRGESIGAAFKSAVMNIADIAGGILDIITFGLFKGSKRFVDFKERMNLFFEYVNGLLFELSFAFGLTDKSEYNMTTNPEIADGTPEGDNGYFGNSNLNGVLTLQRVLGRSTEWSKQSFSANNLIRYVRFVIYKGSSVSESWSNSVSDHPLQDAINSIAEEQDTASKTGGMTIDPFSNPKEVIQQIMASKAKNWVGTSIGALGGAMSGKGRISLPNIWSNSSFSRSYSLNFKLYSPYGDKISVFENVYIPLMSLLAMSLPRKIGRLGYSSPFIIRIYSPGLFACNFGIVESINIQKGEEKNERTIDGISKYISVTLNIKDLIPEFTMSMTRGLFAPLHKENAQLNDWMWVLSGQTLAEKERSFRDIDKFIKNFKYKWNKVKNGDFVTNLYQGIPIINSILTETQKFSYTNSKEKVKNAISRY